MPLYEYRCLKCGRVTELLQKLNDPPLARCTVCQGKVEKLISRTSFQLKGGGWYAQGYGSRPETSESSGAASAGKADAAVGKAEPAESAAAKDTSKKTESKGSGSAKKKKTGE
jgi:putative FmdB family regulatory protein